MIRRTHEGFRWKLAPEFAPRHEAVLAAPARVVKESAAKRVAAHEAAGTRYFLKHYRHDAFTLRPLKFFFKRSQAAREWQLAALAADRGIRTVPHVALGERWTARGLCESVLVTTAFDGVPIEARHASHFPAVIAFVDKLATAGFVHTDFHAANLLLDERTGELCLVDLDGLALATDRHAARDHMLAQLAIHLPLPLARDVQALAHEMRRRALADRSWRCLKTNRDFARRSFGELQWHVRLAAVNETVETILRAPDTLIARGRKLKDGRSSTVVAGSGLVLKRFNFRRWLRPVKDLFRESRARAAFRKAYHLELCGVATARVLAAADERCCGLVRRGFVLMEEIPGAVELRDWSGDPRTAARAAGELLARLHHEGFSHRDLKETNIVFDRAGVPHLIDLEGLRFEGNAPNAVAAANLRRFAQGAKSCKKATRPAAIGFLLAYCRARRMRPRALFPK